MLLEPEIEDLDRKKSDILGNTLYIIRIYNIRITYDAICELCAKKLIKMDKAWCMEVWQIHSSYRAKQGQY